MNPFNAHNSFAGGLIHITLWSFPEEGRATQENISTDCGFVSVEQSETFDVDQASTHNNGSLYIDINIRTKHGGYVTELKDYSDSDPPFKCFRIKEKK